MNKQQRSKLMEYQTRAYTEGTAEYINDDWIFFDDETEEASTLAEYLLQEIEVYNLKKWRKGFLFEDGKIKTTDGIIMLKNNDRIRIRKHLVFSLERLLEEINDDSFYQFVTTLNSLKFSIYDCIYCYNHLTFLKESNRKNGVNMMIFDNEEAILSVHHHFYYHKKISDRFEFTLNSGKRMIIEKIAN